MATQTITPQASPNPWMQAPQADQSFADYAMNNYPKYNATYDPKSMDMTGTISGWLPTAHLANANRQKMALDQGVNAAAGAAAKGRSNLAAQGGLSSGARERVGEDAMKDYMDMSQKVAGQGMQSDLEIDQKGQELGAQAKSANITNALAEGERKNQYSMDVYKTQMQAQAAERQAQATENSGKGK